jgi:hypothetical protein
MTPQQILAIHANQRRIEGLTHWLMQHAAERRQQQAATTTQATL